MHRYRLTNARLWVAIRQVWSAELWWGSDGGVGWLAYDWPPLYCSASALTWDDKNCCMNYTGQSTSVEWKLSFQKYLKLKLDFNLIWGTVLDDDKCSVVQDNENKWKRDAVLSLFIKIFMVMRTGAQNLETYKVRSFAMWNHIEENIASFEDAYVSKHNLILHIHFLAVYSWSLLWMAWCFF